MSFSIIQRPADFTIIPRAKNLVDSFTRWF